jgi:hypothetical protein
MTKFKNGLFLQKTEDSVFISGTNVKILNDKNEP